MNLYAAPPQEEMRPGTAPYAALFGGATAGFVEPFMDTWVVPRNGQRMATYRWPASTTMPRKGIIVLVHGIGEHLGRYNHVANYFAKRGYEVVGIDHLIHGNSDGFGGAKGYLENIDVLVNNFTEFVLAEVAPKEGPHFVFSHSTGGLVLFLSMDGGLPGKWAKLKGVVYQAPLLRLAGPMAQVYCCPSCAYCLLTCSLGACCGTCCVIDGVLPGQLSTHKPFEEATRRDPLYFAWKTNFSIMRALLQGTIHAQKNLDKPTYPFIVLVSPGDQLVSAAVARELYEKAPSSVKSYESDVFNGREHEIHNEEDWEKPLELAVAFLQKL